MWFGLMTLGLVAWALPAAAAHETGELEEPIKIMAAGQAIDVGGGGHCAPFVGDFDGDGVSDLLVGQLYEGDQREGRLRIYRNLGTSAMPRFGGYAWFRSGAETGRVPAG